MVEVHSSTIAFCPKNRMPVTIPDTSRIRVMHQAAAQFLGVSGELGLPMAQEKTEGSTTTLTFWGIEFDITTQALWLTLEKLVVLRDRIFSLATKKVTLKKLQQLVGHLNFACKFVAPGRTFLCCLCDTMSSVRLTLHMVHINSKMYIDLLTWQDFLVSFNGV